MKKHIFSVFYLITLINFLLHYIIIQLKIVLVRNNVNEIKFIVILKRNNVNNQKKINF